MALINKLQLARDVLRRRLGRWLFDKACSRPADDGKSKVVLLRWDAKLGDAIVSSWVAREIHKAQPGREVWVVTTPAMAPLFREHFGVDRVVEIPKRPGYGELKRLARSLGRVGYLVHLGKSLKMKDIYFLSQVDACHVAGMDDELACIDIKLGARTAGRHFADKFAELLACMGIASPDTRYIIPAKAEWESALAVWWPTDRPVIAFNPYGSGGARRLRPDRIASMLEIMLAGCSQSICLLFPPGLEQEVAGLKAGASAPERIRLSPEQPSLGGLFTQLRHSAALVSVDTATVHIAAGLGLPILGLYNPDLGGGGENYAEWHPNTPDAMILFSTSLETQDINSLDMQAFEQAFARWVATMGGENRA
ncbi:MULTISPECIES: glycosyltransferase family 9 protein [Aeromonas]|uniref:glycosyltransferase family 9 protein n=1 Tax=Aeromonas TaxID=642 RepID=UPI0005A9A2CB|nr:glycosyltransferase family 9 protein [Aeromonas enteropelogenes]UBH53571.1 lipopolysaccharide heptosyltransferase family protein [Aeromonas enteropelogenes]